MIRDGRFAIVQRGITSGGRKVNEIVAAGVGIFIDFDG